MGKHKWKKKLGLQDEMTGESLSGNFLGAKDIAKEVAADGDLMAVKAIVFGDTSSGSNSGSKQGDDAFRQELANDYIAPPYHPGQLLALVERSARLSQCIGIMTANTVGLGWDTIPTIETDEDTSEEILAEIDRQAKVLEFLLLQPNEKQSFTDLMTLVSKDEESTGNGYLEVGRDDFGRINGLFWAPAKSIRRTRKHTWVQIRSGGKTTTYFKDFGDDQTIDSRSGMEFKEDTPAEEIEKYSASELIHFKIPTVSNSIYGLPRWIPAIPAIVGSHLVDQRNVCLFENEAIPKFAIIIEGGELHEKSRNALESFWNAKTKGVKNAGRTILLQAEMKKSSINRENNVRIRLEPLTLGITEDASFQNYKKANNNEIRESFVISDIFFESASANRASGDIGRQITNEQVFKPEAKRKEHHLFLTIVKDVVSKDFSVSVNEAKTRGQIIIKRLKEERIEKGKSVVGFAEFLESNDNPQLVFIEEMEAQGVRYIRREAATENDEARFFFESLPLIKIRFNRSTTQDLVNQAAVDDIYAKHGALTPNDLRVRAGYKKYPNTPEFAWANLPLSVAVVQANRGDLPGSGSLGSMSTESSEGGEAGRVDDGKQIGIDLGFIERLVELRKKAKEL